MLGHFEPTSLPPAPTGVPLFGNLLDMRRDPLDLLERGFRERGDLVRFRMGPFDFLMVNDPATVRTVLLERDGDFGRSPTYSGLALVLGRGLLTSEGPYWRRHRKLMTPAFHHRRLVGFSETMVRCTSELGDRWEGQRNGAGELPEPVNIHAAMLALTFRIVGLTLFSTDLSDRAEAMGPALETVLEHAEHVALSLLLAAPPWVPTPRNLRFKRALAVVDDVVLRIISERRQRPGDRGDLLSMLMAARDEQGGPGLSDRELRDEITTLVLAGHETTAQALTWTLMLLSQHPEVERRLAAEIAEVCGERPPCYEDLAKLELCGRVINESMRLYPPAWIFERQARNEVEIAGHRLRPQTVVAVSPWMLHRHPDHWDNPEGFDPDRFTPERSAGRPRYAYLPFGGGPRQCIGNNFALIEAKLVLAALVQRFRFELLSGQDLRPEPAITLRPRAGLQMRVRVR